MKRYPAFDPPEYVDWKADPALVEEFDARVRGDSARGAVIDGLGGPRLLMLYEGMVRNRLHDIALKRLLDGQFEECGLSLQELHTIEDSLVKSLTAVYHGRVKYPSQATA